MLQNVRELFGHKLAALDGDIGHVKDFYFDDTTWAVRHLVADTGSWLTERLVPLTHHALGDHAFGRSDADADVLRVDLTRNPSSIGQEEAASCTRLVDKTIKALLIFTI